MKDFYYKRSGRTRPSQEQTTLFKYEILDIEDYQSRSPEVGTEFEICCNTILLDIGFQLQGKKTIHKNGVEVDQVARNRKGIPFYFEFKGSRDGPRPGLIRTDSMKKALCNAFLLARLSLRPFVIMTSHKPKQYSASFQMLRSADEVVFDVICLSDRVDLRRLEQYVDFDNEAITGWDEEKRQHVLEENNMVQQSLSFFSIWGESPLE
jgi:hypothetical protein